MLSAVAHRHTSTHVISARPHSSGNEAAAEGVVCLDTILRRVSECKTIDDFKCELRRTLEAPLVDAGYESFKPFGNQLYQRAGFPASRQNRIVPAAQLGSTTEHVAWFPYVLWRQVLNRTDVPLSQNDLSQSLERHLAGRTGWEIGAGGGYDVALLRSLGMNAKGIDARMYDFTPRGMHAHIVVEGDSAEVLRGLPPGSVDLMYSSNVFCRHEIEYADAWKIMEAAYHALRPDGTIIHQLHFTHLSPEASLWVVIYNVAVKSIERNGTIDHETVRTMADFYGRQKNSRLAPPRVSNRPILDERAYTELGFSFNSLVAHGMLTTILKKSDG